MVYVPPYNDLQVLSGQGTIALEIAIAAFLKAKEQFRHQRIAIVICGANVSLQTLKSIF